MTLAPPFPPAADLVAAMERTVTGDRSAGDGTWAAIMGELVVSNLRQWDLEDTTRDAHASDAVVAGAKREIDRLNISRHRLVEEIDAAIDSSLDQATAAPMATESPGMVLDRMSVLVIRRIRTAAASSQHPDYADRVLALDTQLVALSMALDCYMQELRAGNRRFLRYQSLKLYGPSAPAP